MEDEELERWLPRLGDPLAALALVAETSRTLRRLERLVVDEARRQAATWDEIGAALGVSRQAAHRRHRPFTRW